MTPHLWLGGPWARLEALTLTGIKSAADCDDLSVKADFGRRLSARKALM
jgi:hypothetical protein